MRASAGRATAPRTAALVVGALLLAEGTSGCRPRARAGAATASASAVSAAAPSATPTASGSAAARSEAVGCVAGTRCVSVLVLHTDGVPPPPLADDLSRSFEQANQVFAPQGVSFRFAPDRDLRRTEEPLLDQDCTLALPPGATLAQYRNEGLPPPCDPEPNVRARLRLADSQPGRLVLFHGSGRARRWDPSARQWLFAARRTSQASPLLPYVTLAAGAAQRQWTVAHELGHYFGLRHPHGPELESAAAVERWLCTRERTHPETLLFDGDRGFVDDTPADPLTPLYRAVQDRGNCEEPAAWERRPLELDVDCGSGDRRLLRFSPAPLRENVMSYWSQDCPYRVATLTSSQGRVVRRALDGGHRGGLVGRPRRGAAPAPVLVRFQGFDHVFATAPDGSVRHHWVGAGRADSLEGWLEAANDFAADTALSPAALVTGDRLHLWVVDRSGRARHKAWDGEAWAPEVQGWADLGGALASRVVPVAVTADAPELFARGRQGGLWHRAATTGEWQRIEAVGEGAPTAVALRGELHLVARASDGTLRHRVRGASGWSEAATLPLAATIDDPALVTMGAQVVLVVRTAAGELLGATRSGQRWTAWPAPLAGGVAGAPAALATAPDRLRVLFTDRSGGVSKLELAFAGDLPAPSAPQPLGGEGLAGTVVVLADGRHTRLLADAPNGDRFGALLPVGAAPGPLWWTFGGRW